MAESFGLSQLGQLINGKSIYATSGIVTGRSAKRHFRLTCPMASLVSSGSFQ